LAGNGYEGASTNCIADEAGVGIATLYRYFNDKDELVEAVALRLVSEVEKSAGDAIIASLNATPDDALRNVILAVVTAMEPRTAVFRVLVDQLPQFLAADERMGAMQGRMTDLGRAAVIHGLGLKPGPETDEVVFLGAGTMMSLCIQIALRRPNGMDRERLIDHGVRMLTTWLVNYQESAEGP
jgi:AcrR family transcriptional regulator